MPQDSQLAGCVPVRIANMVVAVVIPKNLLTASLGVYQKDAFL